MLPNFLVVGAQKAGTTSLHHYLFNHPDIYLPGQKETKFFVIDERYEKGLQHYEQEYFGGRNSEAAVGEVDPDYMYFHCALERMQKDLDLSSIKLIFVFRNPVERAFSHYLMTYRRGLENLSFEDALENESERIGSDFLSDMHFSYQSRGYYYRQVMRFLQYMDREQMLFLLTEDLKENPVKCTQSICRFLNVTTSYIPANANKQFHKATVPRSNSLLRRIRQKGSLEKKIVRLLVPWESGRKKLREMALSWNQTPRHDMAISDATRKWLSSCYEQENKLLAELIGRDLSHW